MLAPYTKSFKSIADQVALLKQRGLDVGGDTVAGKLLEQYGYYRLSGYWYLLRQISIKQVGRKLEASRLDAFKLGTTLSHAVALAEFDRKLRSLFLDAIERIEVGVRVQVALLLGPRARNAHRDGAQFHGNFVKKLNPRSNQTGHAAWLERLDSHESRSKEEFTKHHRAKYGGSLPVWVSIEVWDFGLLSTLVSGMTIVDKEHLARVYNLPRWELLTKGLRAINHIRNISAHHSRLWNRSPADQPASPRLGELPDLDHLTTDSLALVRLYSVAAFMQYLLRSIEPDNNWAEALKKHFKTFPAVPGVAINDTGFPQDWETLPLWR